jgi:hypothetical protein
MAKLEFSPVAFEIECMIDEGRRAEAIGLARKTLHARYGGDTFLRLVAELLRPATRKRRGRPQVAYPRHWLRIGSDFENGANIVDIMKRYRVSESHARKAIERFQKAKREHDSIF